jgi:hypothetical protein
MCISIKITTKLNFAHILQKHFNLSNEFVISLYYLCYRFLRICSLKAGFRYKRVRYNRSFYKVIHAIGDRFQRYGSL